MQAIVKPCCTTIYVKRRETDNFWRCQTLVRKLPHFVTMKILERIKITLTVTFQLFLIWFKTVCSKLSVLTRKNFERKSIGITWRSDSALSKCRTILLQNWEMPRFNSKETHSIKVTIKVFLPFFKVEDVLNHLSHRFLCLKLWIAHFLSCLIVEPTLSKYW